MASNLAKVALPFASWTLLLALVAQALSMKGGWTVIAADELAMLFAECTLVCVAIGEALRLPS